MGSINVIGQAVELKVNGACPGLCQFKEIGPIRGDPDPVTIDHHMLKAHLFPERNDLG